MDTILIDTSGERIDGLPPLPGYALRSAPLIYCAQRCWQQFRLVRSRPEAVRAKCRVDHRPVGVIPLRVEPLLVDASLARGVNHVPKYPPFDSNGGGGCRERKISPPVVKRRLNVHLPHVRQDLAPADSFSPSPNFHPSYRVLLFRRSRPHEKNSRAIIKRDLNLN